MLSELETHSLQVEMKSLHVTAQILAETKY